MQKTFTLQNKTFEISDELDAFNTYRLMFRDLANQAANELTEEYNSTIHNLDEFLSMFPSLYRKKMEPLIQKCIDILISENIWTVTYDSFFEQHLNDFHLALDDYHVILDNFNKTAEANQQRKANMWGYVPGLIGGGFGIMGALKGIATATAYNLVRDSIEASSLQNINVKPEQRVQIYKGLNTSVLFERIFVDYWRTFLSLVFTLNKNGKNIWWPNQEVRTQNLNIFTNLSNPQFPQDKIIDMMIQIFQTSPYNIEFYKYYENKFGPNEEFNEVKNYFGYTSFNDPRIG